METTKAKEFKKRTKSISKLVKIEIEEYIKDFFKDNNINLIEIRYDEDVWEVLNEKLCRQ